MKKKISFVFPLIFCLLLLLCVDLKAQTPDESKTLPQSKESIKDSQDVKAFESVEIEPSVNIAAWRSHLQKKLLPYINKASNKGMKPGIYTVSVRFLVEKDGSISEAESLDDPGYGLADAAVKVVKSGPRWTAGELNGKKVRSYHTQPISFAITEK
jgi:protein TonB